jgi:putative transposase
MKRSRFSEEQIIAILKEADGEPVKTVCARHNISQAAYYQWKSQFLHPHLSVVSRALPAH